MQYNRWLLVLTAALEKKVREMHELVKRLEEEKYDWEVKLRRQDYEVNRLRLFSSRIFFLF